MMSDFSNLNADKRRKKILDILNEEGKVKVSELSQIFSISEVTIRNDLADLERENALERVHGGAIPSMRTYYSMNFYERKTKHAEEKHRIAAAAADMIHDRDTVMLSSGTTSFFIARELKSKKHLKVVTNSVNIATEMSDSPYNQIILLGGNIKFPHSFTYGDDTLVALRKYKADVAILSIDGVSATAGISIRDFEETEVSRLMIERSKYSIAVTDLSKIGQEGFSQVADIDSIDYLITDTNALPAHLEKIVKKGVNVVTV